MSADSVNYLNVVLMLLSAGLAFSFPFETFLLAYAVLGPLHYLTEISWLHDRNYYTPGKRDFLFLTGASALVSALFFGWLSFAPKGTPEFTICVAFLGALVFVLFKTTSARVVGLFASALAAFLFSASPTYLAIFGMFLPTLIHVFLFTGMFILMGALRGKSKSGLLSLLVFGGVGTSFFFIHPARAAYHASEYVRGSYGILTENGNGTSPFISMNYYLVRVFRLHDFGRPAGNLAGFVATINDYLYQNPLALSLMSFIAFAYTYHYFNWFSKTSIIGWHEIPKSRAALILGIWGISLGLYAYDYSVGLRWLFFLSLTHVLLEFPLNHLTAIGIGRECWNMVFGGPKPGQKVKSSINP